MLLASLLLTAQTAAAPAPGTPAPRFDPALAERFARLALACVGKEYPNKIAHVMNGDADVRPARELTPAFFGCFDWHSSVHGHWLLARVARLLPETPVAAEAQQALERSLTPEKIAAEVLYLNGQGRASFERPYGLAWLLQLAAELREWGAAGQPTSGLAERMAAALRPLEQACAARLSDWLPKLTAPIRSGEHSQTAFALGLVLDWARGAGDAQTLALVEQRSRAFYGADRACPLGYEPSGEDFLSPCLAEADLMRRVLPPAEFARWFAAFLPHVPEDGSAEWLAPGIVTDPSDPKLAHLDGLNLSRAFMLEGIAAGLPAGDARKASLLSAAARHRAKGLAAVTGEHYEGGHWLGTFAVHLVTERGLGPPRPASPSPRAAAPSAEGPRTLNIGAAAPDFDLPGSDGRRYTLASFAGAELLVIIFTANHCPTAQAYEERIERLHAEFQDRGAQLVLVSPNDPLALRLDEQGYTDLGDTLEEMKLRAEDRGWTFPYLYDGETQAMSRQYGPAATPHVFVFDAERKLRFVGRIDDDENPAKAKTADARDAIDALLAGRPVPVAKTKVFGCSIKWSDKRGWVKEGLESWAREPVTMTPVDPAGVKAVAQGDARKLRLVNVWATWCAPCVIEFPDLVSLHRIYRGRDFEVVTLNADDLDQKEKARAFLAEKQASMRNLSWSSDDPYGMIDALDPKWEGGLPYTLLVAPGGKVLYRSAGAFDTRELRRLIVGWLGRYYHSVPGAGASQTGGRRGEDPAPQARTTARAGTSSRSDATRTGPKGWSRRIAATKATR